MPRHTHARKGVLPAGSGRDLCVGIDWAPPEPLQIGGPDSGDFRGFEVDLLYAVKEQLGIHLRFRRARWSQILAKLQNGELDVICSAATVTDDLKREFDFGMPYCDVALGIVSRERDQCKELEDLKGRTMAIRSGTTAAKLVEKRCCPLCINTFETNIEIYDALVRGQADATIDDRPIARALVRKYPSLTVGPTIPGTESHYAMLFRKGHSLRSEIDMVLGRLARTGFIAHCRRKWFGGDETNSP